MENSTSKAAAELRKPIALTIEQTTKVAGGMAPVRGCPSCTSGHMQAFQAQVDRLTSV